MVALVYTSAWPRREKGHAYENGTAPHVHVGTDGRGAHDAILLDVDEVADCDGKERHRTVRAKEVSERERSVWPKSGERPTLGIACGLVE